MTRDELIVILLKGAGGKVHRFYWLAEQCGYVPLEGTFRPFTELVDAAMEDEKLRAKLLVVFG